VKDHAGRNKCVWSKCCNIFRNDFQINKHNKFEKRGNSTDCRVTKRDSYLFVNRFQKGEHFKNLLRLARTYMAFIYGTAVPDIVIIEFQVHQTNLQEWPPSQSLEAERQKLPAPQRCSWNKTSRKWDNRAIGQTVRVKKRRRTCQKRVAYLLYSHTIEVVVDE
ncbi:MAG: hypothetical protein ABJQ14_14110, partial [Hyphomicrobiales bacterium]